MANSSLNKLQDSQKSVLQKLRAIYAHRMLLWSKNKKKASGAAEYGELLQEEVVKRLMILIAF